MRWSRPLLDWWQKIREDFLIWRTLPGNTGLINGSILGVVALLLFYLAIRLWKGRIRHPQEDGEVGRKYAIRTPLHGLTRFAERCLGPRKEGRTFTGWILGLGEILPGIEDDLHRAISYHWKARFDPLGLAPGEAGQFEELCRGLQEKIDREEQQRGTGKS